MSHSAGSQPWPGLCASRSSAKNQMQSGTPIPAGFVKQLKLAVGLMVLWSLGESSGFGISDRVTDWLSEDAKYSQGKLRLGIFDIRPRLAGSMVYDDNIYIQSQAKQSDVLW